MSIDSSRSSTSGGSGTTMSMTTARRAIGTSRCEDDERPATVAMAWRLQHQLADPDEVRQYFGDGPEQVRGNGVADLGALVERLGERLVLDQRHAVLAGYGADLRGEVILALGDDHRRGH